MTKLRIQTVVYQFTEVDMVLMSNKTKSSRPLLFVKVQIQRDEKSGEKVFLFFLFVFCFRYQNIHGQMRVSGQLGGG